MFNRRYTIGLSLALLLALLFLASCGAAQPEDPTEARVTATASDAQSPSAAGTSPGVDAPERAEDGYPAPADNSAYPDPGNGADATLSSTVEEVPTPASDDAGTVTGILLLEQDGERPVREAILYLGRIIMLEDGRPGMSALNKQTAPVTQSNLAGQFIFSDVPPGTYTLVLDKITESFVLSAPTTGEDMIIEVEPGEITDVGELRYSDLPIEEDE